MKDGFLESFGYKIHYVHWKGEGPKILLIHSMGMDGHSMDKLAKSLKDKYEILSLTILGHGDSDSPNTHLPLYEHAEIMRNAYRQLEYHPSVLIGHSVGGMMGMILTSNHPEEYKGLILVDIAPFKSTGRSTRPPPPEYVENEEEARRWLGKRYPGLTDYYVENRLKYAFEKKEGKLWLKPRGDTVHSGLVIDLWPYVERIKCPTLLLIGVESTTVSSETRKKMEKTVSGLKSIMIDDTGHMIPQEVPDKFEELVRDYLNHIY
jgi:pimeloyl-ACP methyl ester carboxylesterase